MYCVVLYCIVVEGEGGGTGMGIDTGGVERGESHVLRACCACCACVNHGGMTRARWLEIVGRYHHITTHMAERDYSEELKPSRPNPNNPNPNSL